LIKDGIFEKKFSYYFSTYSADALTVGMPVKVSGFEVGQVDTIKLLDNGTVELSFSVNEENQKWVSEDSLLMIRKPLIGSSYIILYSAIGNPILKEGSTIQTLISNDINDLVLKLEPIVLKMENIVNSVDKITTYLAKDDSELMKTVKNIEKFSETLAKNKSLLTTITGDKKATESLIKTINELPLLVNRFNNISSDVHKDILPLLTQFVKQLGEIAKDIESKLKTLDGVVNSVGSYDKDLISIKEQIKVGISKSNEIIQKVDTIFQDKKSEKVNLP
jgi:ABC-type transporter Mla subunit MlaD